jgi:hypothetical protein
MGSLVIAGGVIALTACSAARAKPPPGQAALSSSQASRTEPRTPQWASKTRRTPFSDAEIA